ncbi:MAG: ABC transporter permease, partial [Bacteroidota bacterium]
MLTHYLKTAVRFLLRQRIYTVLNVLGLTIGMSCAIVIFLFVQDEWQYDQFHEKKDQIQRLACTYYLPEDAGVEMNAIQGPVVGEMLVKDYPEITQAVRIQSFSHLVLQFAEDNTRHFEDVAFADSNFFDLFSFPLLQGDAQTVLNQPHTIVLSESMARQYFGRTDVVGEFIRMPEETETAFEVTGVMADFPSQSHFKADFIASLQTRYKEGAYMGSWWSFQTYTYLELAKETDVAALETKISDISRRYIADQEDGSGYRQEYSLQPLTSIHLNSDLRGEWEANSKESYVIIFLIIGIFLVLIACVNFVNLATARSLSRAKEVGLRKVVGASRGQL